jgi:hypothetical protein
MDPATRRSDLVPAVGEGVDRADSGRVVAWQLRADNRGGSPGRRWRRTWEK